MVIYAKSKCNIGYTESYQFEYYIDPENKTFQQLYESIDADVTTAGADVEWLTRMPHLIIDGEKREPLEYATVSDLISGNNLNKDALCLYIEYGGIGVSETLDGRIKLEIREKEDPRHKPHVHVNIKGIGEVSIIIGNTRESCEIKEGKNNWKKYSRKDRNDIIQVVIDNYEDFLSFYNDYKERYIKPKAIKFSFRGKQCILEHGSAVIMDSQD